MSRIPDRFGEDPCIGPLRPQVPPQPTESLAPPPNPDAIDCRQHLGCCAVRVLHESAGEAAERIRLGYSTFLDPIDMEFNAIKAELKLKTPLCEPCPMRPTDRSFRQARQT
jgi:hypothetical protein